MKDKSPLCLLNMRVGWDEIFLLDYFPIFPTQLFFQQKLMDLGIFSHYISLKLFFF